MDVRIRQCADYLEQRLSANLPLAEAKLRQLTSWLTGVGCVAHDIRNGLKWALMAWLRESLRKSYAQLARSLHTWLPLAPTHRGWDLEEQTPLLTCLQLEPELVELAVDLQIRYDSGQLCVATKWEGNPQLLQTATTVLLGVWQFSAWSESRWCTLGGCCRSVLAAMVMGMCSIADHTRTKPGDSQYWVKGFQDLPDDIRQLFVVGAMSSFVCDTCLATVLEDDRIAIQLSKLEPDIMEEVGFVCNLPYSIWQVFSKASGRLAALLRSVAMSGCFTSVGFIQSKLRPLVGLYWVKIRS